MKTVFNLPLRTTSGRVKNVGDTGRSGTMRHIGRRLSRALASVVIVGALAVASPLTADHVYWETAELLADLTDRAILSRVR